MAIARAGAHGASILRRRGCAVCGIGPHVGRKRTTANQSHVVVASDHHARGVGVARSRRRREATDRRVLEVGRRCLVCIAGAAPIEGHLQWIGRLHRTPHVARRRRRCVVDLRARCVRRRCGFSTSRAFLRPLAEPPVPTRPCSQESASGTCRFVTHVRSRCGRRTRTSSGSRIPRRVSTARCKPSPAATIGCRRASLPDSLLLHTKETGPAATRLQPANSIPLALHQNSVPRAVASPESVADAADSLDAVGNGAQFPPEAANHDVDRVAATVVTRAPYLAE